MLNDMSMIKDMWKEMRFVDFRLTNLWCVNAV